MATIDLKLKTYDQLVFEITTLNTDKYLLEQKLQQKDNIIKEVRECITSEETIETFRTIESREKWLEINHKLLEILDKGE